MPPFSKPLFGTAGCTGISSLCVANGWDCIAGYQKSTTLDSCVDIDECSLGQCGANTNCINNAGDYECSCIKDYIWDSGSDKPASKERLIISNFFNLGLIKFDVDL